MDRPHEQVIGKKRVLRVERRVVQETVREVATASRPHPANRVQVAAAEPARAPVAPTAERSARAPRAPDPALSPVQSLDDLLRQVPHQAVAQSVAAPAPAHAPAPAPAARPSVTIRRLVVEVTPPAQPPSPAPPAPRRRGGARSDTMAGSSSRLRFGLGQS